MTTKPQRHRLTDRQLALAIPRCAWHRAIQSKQQGIKSKTYMTDASRHSPVAIARIICPTLYAIAIGLETAV